MTDIIKDDLVKFSYYLYGTQIISGGKVLEVDKEKVLVKTDSDRLVEVPLNSIIERAIRDSEIPVQVVTPIETDYLNEGVVGVRFIANSEESKHGDKEDESTDHVSKDNSTKTVRTTKSLHRD